VKTASSREQVRTSLGLREQVLLAALECSRGDLNKSFSVEELLLAAWKRDPTAWGLRGYETTHPDSLKMNTELDRVSIRGRNLRGGLVSLGYLEKVRQRTYRLTPAGLANASELAGANSEAKGFAERGLGDAIGAILSHTVFREWLKDPSRPKHFRDAGHFWGIAPGTPPNVIRSRITSVDSTLRKASELLEKKNLDEIWSRHGRALFDRNDILRAEEFQRLLKQRFGNDLATLGVTFE
jgi:hypothetical protein